jgi:hypothetical protein
MVETMGKKESKMTFTLRQGVREKIGLLFSVAGASGAGKTLSALMLAKGIANGSGKIAVIDTEAGRALHYAPRPGEKADATKGTFDFLHLDFAPPFTPQRYIDAIKACEEAGATVIVIDSMSHEWDGEGGCADIQYARAVVMAKGDVARVEAMNGPAWAEAKKHHKRMMARLIQCRTHLIFCLRAQEKVKIIGGKVTPIGFQPISEKSFPFEMSGSIMMHPNTPGSADWDLPKKLNDDLQKIFPHGQIVGPEAGKRLREWAETGEVRPPEDKAATGVRELIERIEDAGTLEALRAITGGEETMKQRFWLSSKRPELAARVDDAVSAALGIFDAADAGDLAA